MLAVIKKFNILLDKQQKKKVLILFFVTLISAALEVLGVTLMLPLVTAIMMPNIIETNAAVKWVCQLFGLHSHRTFVIVCIVALIGIFVLKNTLLIFSTYIQVRFVYNNRVTTQKKILHAYMLQPYEFYLNAQSGEIFRVIQSDVSIAYNILMVLLAMSSEAIIAITLIITIFVVDPVMTIIVAVTLLILMVIISKVLRPFLRREGIILQQQTVMVNQWVLQAISGIKEVKVMRKEHYFEKKFDEHSAKVIRAEKINSVFGSIPRMMIEMVSVSSMLFIIAIMIYNGRELESIIPTLGAFAMAAIKLMPSANRIVGAMNSVAYGEPAIDKLIKDLEIINKSDTIVNYQWNNSEDNRVTLDKRIELKGVTFRYPNTEKAILNNAEMTILSGKSVGIVGKSGAGKTTVVDIILGLLMPQDGKVLSDGIDVFSNYNQWLSHIGYIPQAIFMLDGTIKENVAFGIENAEIDESAVWRALREAQLEEFVKALPEGIETSIGERGIRLSGGQRQRIGIARALYSDPELLIFDEATSALDNETEAAIMESINGLHGMKTMIIIAHRLQTIEGCDIVYRVDQGEIFRER